MHTLYFPSVGFLSTTGSLARTGRVRKSGYLLQKPSLLTEYSDHRPGRPRGGPSCRMRAVYRLSLTSPTEEDRLGRHRRSCVGHWRETVVPCSSRFCKVEILLVSILHCLVVLLVQMMRKPDENLDIVCRCPIWRYAVAQLKILRRRNGGIT